MVCCEVGCAAQWDFPYWPWCIIWQMCWQHTNAQLCLYNKTWNMIIQYMQLSHVLKHSLRLHYIGWFIILELCCKLPTVCGPFDTDDTSWLCSARVYRCSSLCSYTLLMVRMKAPYSEGSRSELKCCLYTQKWGKCEYNDKIITWT
jgi:hypothetical protein